MRDELHEPLGLDRPPPRARRHRPLLWVGASLVALVAGAALLFAETRKPGPRVAVTIPFSDIAVETPPAPSPTPSPSIVAAPPTGPSVFPPEGGSVAVVRNGLGGDAHASGPQIIDVPQALGEKPPAGPDRRLLETTKYGSLPRIAPDGTKPAEAYARAFSETAVNRGAPRIAVFVGGVGLDAATTRLAIARLPGAVSLGLAPYGSDLPKVAERAREAGHEIWLQAPMEPMTGESPGPHTLTTEASEAENEDSLHWLMGRFTGYVGVANYLGSKFAADPSALPPVLGDIGRRGLLYLDDGAVGTSRSLEIAPGLDLRAARADVTADAAPSADAIDAALVRAEDLARRRGVAIVAASALPMTLERIGRWAEGLTGKGFALAPVSALVGAPGERTAGVSR